METSPVRGQPGGAGEVLRVEAAAIALLGDLGIGVAANVAGCIAAGLAAAAPGWAGRPLTDRDGLVTAASSHLPIPILRGDPAVLAALIERARTRPAGAALVLFPRFAQAMHTAQDYWDEHGARSLANEELLGVGVAGTKTWIRSLTGSMPLLR